jgi:hypothetical protein
MTSDEGRALARGTMVYFGNDPTDRGVVRAVDDNGVWIQWGRDAAPSHHPLTNLARVHRWRRGLRGLSRQDEQHLVREVR